MRLRRIPRAIIRRTAKAVLVPPIVWYLRNLWNTIGGEQRPVFFDIRQTAPALDALTQNYPAIRGEAEALLNGNLRLPNYHDLDPNQLGISGNDQKRWKVFMLYAMGEKPRANRELCPVTAALLDKVPNLYQAFFSILEAGKSVPAHNATQLGVIRYHLGLIVPKDNPPSMRVKNEFHTWQEGSGVLFDDTWNHEVYNNSSGDRVILLVDVLRPLPPLLHSINFLNMKGIIRMSYGKGVLRATEKFGMPAA
jgi:aspartyl/asparaginyl beta-hydroxylase (cupin superfamily)